MALKAPETDAGPGPSTKGHLWKNRVARAKREFELLQQILRKPFDQRTHEDRMAVLKQMSVCQSLGDVSEAGKLKLAGVVGKDSRALLSAFACASSAVLKRWYKQALRSTPPVSQSSWLASTHLRIGTSVPALRRGSAAAWAEAEPVWVGRTDVLSTHVTTTDRQVRRAVLHYTPRRGRRPRPGEVGAAAQARHERFPPCDALTGATPSCNRAEPCSAMLCHAMPWRACRCRAVPCRAVPYRAMPWRATRRWIDVDRRYALTRHISRGVPKLPLDVELTVEEWRVL